MVSVESAADSVTFDYLRRPSIEFDARAKSVRLHDQVTLVVGHPADAFESYIIRIRVHTRER
jgi:hypothetical protein